MKRSVMGNSQRNASQAYGWLESRHDNGEFSGENEEDRKVEMRCAYRVAFAYQVTQFIVAVCGSSGRKGDSLVFCRSSPHCGSDWEMEGRYKGKEDEEIQIRILFVIFSGALWWTREERNREGGKRELLWAGRELEKEKAGGRVLTDGSQKWGDGDCPVLPRC